MALIVTVSLFLWGRTTPEKKGVEQAEHDHLHDVAENVLPVDSLIVIAKQQLNPGQSAYVENLEKNLPGAGQNSEDPGSAGEQLHVYHQLARFWADSAGVFELYAWYTAEAARLENSQKSLTFAARLFLENLQQDGILERRQWKALQAKDLFERSLKINPADDSARVGIGACYLFGNISPAPMEGISRIREVLDKDSTHLYALMTMAKASVLSGQYDKAIERLLAIVRLQNGNPEALLLLADVYERTGDQASAVNWYRQSLPFLKNPEMRSAVEERIKALRP